ncbi:MAG: hypothetical protein Q9213_002317 [Squamulea squamosa]
MREYASPVSSTHFKYTSLSGLYGEVEGHRHGHCSSTDLYSLLTYKDPGPAYTKAGKLKVHQPPKHKDETEHFYAAAKKALLEAFNHPGLELPVPDDIRQVEEDLASQYSMKNAAAKKEYREKRSSQEAEKQKARNKRRHDEAALMAEFLGESSKKAKQTTDKGIKKPEAEDKSNVMDIASLSGIYAIAAPAVSNGWDCGGPLMLEMAPSSTRSHLWGSFNFGVFEGKLRSLPVKGAAGNTVELHWRGRETGNGESTYEPENIASFTFLEKGKFKGTMYWDCLGEFELVGKRISNRSESDNNSRKVKAWKSGYWALNEADYERERVSRWGGWSDRYSDSEEEPNSDTENEQGCNDEDEKDEDGEGDDFRNCSAF